MIGGFRQVIQNEGAGALLTGFGPTFTGYFIQGAFKFGGYEFFKKQSIDILGLKKPARTVQPSTPSLPPALSSSPPLLCALLRLPVSVLSLHLASPTV